MVNTTEIIINLINQNNISALKLTKDLELSNSAITDWKKGKAKPSTEAIIKLAKYFNVSTDYLLTGSDPLPKDLTADQHELLKLYDTLTEIQKAEIKGYMKGLMSK